jgi:hypothetical protein
VGPHESLTSSPEGESDPGDQSSFLTGQEGQGTSGLLWGVGLDVGEAGMEPGGSRRQGTDQASVCLRRAGPWITM